MGCIVRFIVGAVASSALVAVYPAAAAAQHTLSGRLVEQLPGGASLPNPGVFFDRVAADGTTTFLGSVTPCAAGATTNCVASDGTFTITDLIAGTYQLSMEDGISPVLDKVLSVDVSANVDVGTVALVRQPFKIEVNVGPVPPNGGIIPVTARVRTTWSIPTIPILALIEQRQATSAEGYTRDHQPQRVSFVWPAVLADSGTVTLPSLTVAPDDPSGSFHCVQITLLLQGTRRTLGTTITCSGKRP